MEKIKVGDYLVTVERKRIKNMYLRVLPEYHLKVTCNKQVSQESIVRFINERSNWIEKQVLSLAKSNAVNRETLDMKSVYWMGEKLPVKTILGAKRDICYLSDGYVVFELKEQDEEKMQKVFRKAAANYLMYLVNQRRNQWDERICRTSIHVRPQIGIRYMTSRWGVCQPKNAKITLSTRLIHYPVEALEYVLLHEYVHFVVPDHSSNFYHLLSIYMPQYKEYEALLK